jgi:ribonuclease HI
VRYANGAWIVKCEPDKPLADVISRSPHRNWLLFVDSIETLHLDALTQALEPLEKTHSFGIYTHSQMVARYLRKKAPQWVYAADSATLLRLHIFSSFWIETSFDFWPDFIVQSRGDKASQLSEREMSELKRRKKRVIKVEFTP